jgi:polyphosphate kinase
MPRNLDHRVEVVFPVENKAHIRYLRHQILDVYLHDNMRARVMQPDGTYARRQPPAEDRAVDVQVSLMQEHKDGNAKPPYLSPIKSSFTGGGL